jgi:hypothetical protein
MKIFTFPIEKLKKKALSAGNATSVECYLRMASFRITHRSMPGTKGSDFRVSCCTPPKIRRPSPPWPTGPSGTVTADTCLWTTVNPIAQAGICPVRHPNIQEIEMKKSVLVCIAFGLTMSGGIFMVLNAIPDTQENVREDIPPTAVTAINATVPTGQKTHRHINRSKEKKRFLQSIASAARNQQVVAAESVDESLQRLEEEQLSVQRKLASATDSQTIAQLKSYQNIITTLQNQLKEQ